MAEVIAFSLPLKHRRPGQGWLEVEEVAGLPAPKSSSSKGSEKTPFRLVVSAQVNADFQSVLAFYRRELEKRGWKEQDTKVKTKPGELAFGYVSPEGPAVLKLSSSNEDTAITLTVRKPAEAQKAGVLPENADAFLKECRDSYGLTISGVMCIPPAEEPPAPHFALTRKIADRNGLKLVSMGMSADFAVAIAMGATHVRVGSAIFGTRTKPHN